MVKARTEVGDYLKILAFDQASFKTGVAYFDGTTLLESAVIDYSKVKDTKQRVEQMILSVLLLIKEKCPDVVVIEDVALQRNAAVLIMLSRIQGAILGHCFEKGIVSVIYKPSQWRSMLGFIQGGKVKRADLKKQAMDFVMEHYGREVAEDEADAICIGCAFACALTNEAGEENAGE